MQRSFLLCESHPGRPLVEHLCEVRALLDCASAARLFPLLPLAGLCHDLAKATSYFQDYLHVLPAEQRLRTHALASAVLFLSIFRGSGNGSKNIFESALLFEFIRRHHGALGNLADDLSLGADDVRVLEKQFHALDLSGMRRWLFEETSLSLGQEFIPTNRELTALRVAVRRHLATDAEDAMMRLQGALTAFGALIDADRDSAARVAGLPAAEIQFTQRRLNEYRHSIPTSAESRMATARSRVFESACERGSVERWDGGRLWSLTVPTGAGKTLAALGWALALRERKQAALGRAASIIYALPFTSIIDQNSAVVASICGPHAIEEGALAIHHHLADYGDLALRESPWSPRSWAEAWKAEVVSTTFVQVFDALFHGRAADARRFSRLSGGILILDEVQAVPAHLWTVTKLALSTLASHLSTDVLLVTATQPAIFSGQNVEEIAPSHTDFAGPFDRYDLEIETRPIDLKALADIVCNAAKIEPRVSILVILNTVREALRLHGLLRANASLGSRLFHLSTNLRPIDRRRVLQSLIRMAVPFLVSTQVVEAGVDLSFHHVYRAAGPIDSIVQAAGRCNRHGDGPRGRVSIVNLDGSSASIVYGQTLVGAAREVLSSIAGPMREPDLGLMVHNYFTKVAHRVSSDPAAAIIKSVQRLEFEALRGDDDHRLESKVCLIDPAELGVPHFVEIDENDHAVWSGLHAAIRISDARVRRTRLRQIRSQVTQRVVEVPKRDASGEPTPETGLVYVPAKLAGRYYNSETGWLRQL